MSLTLCRNRHEAVAEGCRRACHAAHVFVESSKLILGTADGESAETLQVVDEAVLCPLYSELVAADFLLVGDDEEDLSSWICPLDSLVLLVTESHDRELLDIVGDELAMIVAVNGLLDVLLAR